MGRWQSVAPYAVVLTVCGLSLGVCCDRGHAPPPASPAALPTVVSLVPAATDILVGMGAQGHLVGVSNYDQNPATATLPRLGDYLTTDWEKIGQLRPQAIITQYAPGRTPQGFSQNASSLGIVQLNLHIDALEEIFSAIARLGKAVNEPIKAADAERRLRGQLDSVRKRVAEMPRVRTLIFTDDAGRQTVGRGTFLDDVLSIAGGENALPADAPLYPALDREQLATLAPEAIFQLLPDTSPQVLEQARRAWIGLEIVPAVKNHRVYTLNGWNVELPGLQVGELAIKFADRLHPDAALPTSGGQPKVAAP